MKESENQILRTSGVLLTSALLAICVFVIRSPWNSQGGQLEAEKALQKAQVVGYQIIHLYREAAVGEAGGKAAEALGSGRMPASVEPGSVEMRTSGTMGLDPWGQPYRYRFMGNDAKSAAKVVIWSSGPNKIIESHNLENEESLILEQPEYQGDDLGVVIAL